MWRVDIMLNVLLVDFKDSLIDKFGYEEGLAQDITIMAESIIDHLGVEYESVVLDAVANTKVILANGYNKTGIRETIGDILEREDMETDIVGEDRGTLSTLRNLEGIYKEKPHIIYKDGTYKIEDVKKVAVINSEYIPESPYFLGKLAGELLKSVNSHLVSYKIEDDSLIIRSGLHSRTEKLSFENGNVKRELVSERGYGLEEGITKYDQMALMRKSYYDDYDLSNNNMSTLISGTLIDGLKLKEAIHTSQITKDYDPLRELIDNHCSLGYDGLIDTLDNLSRLEKNKNGLVNSNELTNAQEALDEYFQREVVPVLQEMRLNMKLGVDENVIGKS